MDCLAAMQHFPLFPPFADILIEQKSMSCLFCHRDADWDPISQTLTHAAWSLTRLAHSPSLMGRR